MEKQLKVLPFDASEFEANGKKYFIETNLSISRFVEYQILEKEAGFGITFDDFYNNLENVYNSLNDNKVADASVKLYNLMSGVINVQKKEPILLKMAALFINEENEDRSTITADQITRKIEDWKTDFYVEGFFALASNLVSGYATIYARVVQHISERETKKKAN